MLIRESSFKIYIFIDTQFKRTPKSMQYFLYNNLYNFLTIYNIS